MTGVESPFLDRLAVADGAWTPQEFEATNHAQHAGQDSRHSDAHMREASQPAAGSASAGPDQATAVASKPDQATRSDLKPNQATGADFKPNQASAQEAQSDELLAGGLNNEEEGLANHQHSAADPMAGGQTLASNLAFQQELQQRSSERHARAGFTGRGQQMAEGGVPQGQEGGQRNQRYHIKLTLTLWHQLLLKLAVICTDKRQMGVEFDTACTIHSDI